MTRKILPTTVPRTATTMSATGVPDFAKAAKS